VANEVIKKVKIASADLPLIQFTTLTAGSPSRTEIDDLYYDFRYRIVSQDKNRTSAWSSIERLVMPDVPTPFPYTSDQRISISENGGNPKVITAIWTKPLAADNPSDYENTFNKINIYDVWIRWTETNNATEESSGWTSWSYVTTVSSNTFSIVKPDADYKTVEVAIQIPTEVKLRDYNNNKLTLFKKFGAV
jgi:hypothetical protein